MIRTSDLTKRFGGLTAVDGVEFELGENELCSLIGPNGAGKTTFFNLLTGTLAPTAGSVEFREDGGWTDVTDDDPHETALRGVHRSYQISNLFPTATTLENVRVAAQAHGGVDSWKLWRNADAFERYEREARAILDRVGLADEADTPAEALSHGQKRHLEVAIALAGDPDVLLLDEPTAGVSSDAIDRLVELIRSVAEDHAVLLVEHNMDVVMDVSDRVAVLHQGELIADGPPNAVREDSAVQEAYLGGYEADATGDTSTDTSGDADPGGEAA
ncbi:amino acid/amide ABC transporter ATP-binding protein 1, HAAT family [Natronoarchaeum philippinense]|uniref:Amino acid/amide ABC transporter ATP-binding protein 1, HAAT family n=1 Tax=Natronoarchaeum philippinense TaxID=558529 RepID=A0A285NBH7_NATPI|nr:ABC transporter ATP-binding protein [Natronoarchaeum philippinense]SNZ06844.1 amino acid/amide ABC transporter ATP-binding protein 1, HAAT family [Natronoarchaeum philippinense]